jgi:hypothetical protein
MTFANDPALKPAASMMFGILLSGEMLCQARSERSRESLRMKLHVPADACPILRASIFLPIFDPDLKLHKVPDLLRPRHDFTPSSKQLTTSQTVFVPEHRVARFNEF